MRTIKTVSIVTILVIAFSFASSAQGMKYVKIKTSAQTELCKTTIENSLAYEKGVKNVDLDLKSKVVVVKYAENKTNYDDLCAAITKLGYDADDQKADKDAFTKLPSECKPLSKQSDCGSKYTKKACSSKCGSHK